MDATVIGWHTLRVISFIGGASLVLWTLQSAIRAFVLPRNERVAIQSFVFRIVLSFFLLRLRRIESYLQRDRIMAYYAPVSLLFMPIVCLVLILAGYMVMFWAVGMPTWKDALILSGSSLFTLGFAIETTYIQIFLIYSEATIGLGLVALLISYLPTMYGAFSQREHAVAMLEVRAGDPPSAIELLKRFHRLQRLDALDEFFVDWEKWFANIEETHTSLPALVFFRSPLPQRSWVTAAGTVLDSAALYASCIAPQREAYRAALCIRAGYIALRQIADFFELRYHPAPKSDTPISLTFEEFKHAYQTLVDAGIEMRQDVEPAWEDFRGWRVNYDAVLIQLANLTLAPTVPWVSDRSLVGGQPLLKGVFGRIRHKMIE